MFSGNYAYKVDEKGRMPLPRQFREQLKREKGGIITECTEKCIAIYSQVGWDKRVKEVSSKRMPPADRRKLNRAMFGNAFVIHFDGQGRITLPGELRDRTEITYGTIVIGCGDRIEIWNEEWGKTAISEAREESPQIENMSWEHE
jgi:MraZ protein